MASRISAGVGTKRQRRRAALQPLMEAYAFDAAESGGAVRFFHRGDGAATILTADDLALADADDEAGPSIVTADPAELPGAVAAVPA